MSIRYQTSPKWQRWKSNVNKKVVVLGLDGLEPTIVESMLERGELPNLARLRQGGSYTRLGTTYPAQTPVAWSSFATGTNPGGHGIYDFIRRDPNTYQPDLALSQFEPPKSIFAQPRVVSRRKGVPIWQVLANAGIASTVLRCPCTFPPDADCGRILAGVGVPDLRGGQGTGTFYTQDRTQSAKENEQLVQLPSGDNFKTQIIGPRNTRLSPPTDFTIEARVQVDRGANALKIETGGARPGLSVPTKTWSPWVRIKFKLSMLQSVCGLVRFYVRQISPHVEFYASPVNFDPAAPLFPISAPASYARELSEQIGFFSTLGMAEDHNGHNNGRFDEDDYKAQCDLTFEEREKMMFFELDRFREGFFYTLFDTPDRLQHMFWRFTDPEHPLYNREQSANFGHYIEALYQRCDRMLARVMEKVDETTLLIVLSDHGFNSFRRAFDTNTWLWQNNLLSLKNDKKPGDYVDCPAAIEWSRTYAYAMGLGGIYLNMRGRESAGIVTEGAEAERVCNAIAKGLTGVADSKKQVVPIRSVSRREEIYSGAYVSDAPDLLVNFAPGYRVSWQSALGGFSHELVQDNDRFWSGDHIIDPDAVAGILFTNRPLQRNRVNIVDLAPTVLNYLGVSSYDAMEGKSLLG
jgi:predicted AlkP superfamily phosphohydrolase/phosphomutase